MRYHIIQDGRIIGSTETRDEALDFINQRKARETHWLKSEFWIILGTEEFLR